jgi:RHS repeat-associated protein
MQPSDLAVILNFTGHEMKTKSKSAFKKRVYERLSLAITMIFLGCFFVSGSYRNTGQRNDLAIGPVFYNAKSYDAARGHFIQTDTIVPSPGNRKNLYRYAYVLDDPLKDTTPTDYRPYTPPTLISREQWYGMYLTQKRAMTVWSHITHSGRKEVIRNAEQISALSTDYSVDATMVAAAIAQQASDVERILGDFSDELSEEVGALSVGISQLHRTELKEFHAKGLLPSDIALDPYDPEVAIRGMAAKIQLNDEYLGMMICNLQ